MSDNAATTAPMNAIHVSRKVLLVKPDDNGFYPVGFSYLAGAWQEAGIPYDYVDMFLYPDFDIEALIKSQDYLAVCTGGLLGSFTFFQTLFSRVKSVSPGLPCILGGNVTMDFPTGLLFQHTPVDYLVIGEGEVTASLLLEHIERNGIAPTDLLGVAYRSPEALEGYVRNKRRPPLDLAAHNWQPTWDFLEVERYAQRPHCRLRLFPVLTGRGCRGRCSFCSPTNGQYRGRPLPFVFQEIESLIERYDFDYLHFLTEIFFQDEAEVLEFCRRYKTLGVRKPWACLQRMDTSPHVLAAMKDAGCFTINVGVESGSDAILREMKKDITVDQTRTFIDRMKACGIGVEASFMMGNYAETEADIIKTVDLMLELGVGGPKAMCVNYPGTLNFSRAQKRGLVQDVLAYAKGLRRAYAFDWLQHIETHKAGQLQYLNVTDMDDEMLFAVVIREMRRLHEHGYHMRQVRATPLPQADPALPAVYRLEGACPFCGADVSSTVYLDELDSFMDTLCPNCLAYQQKAFFAPLDVPPVAEEFARQKPALDAAERIVLAGPDHAIRLLLQRGYTGLDFSKIVGVLPLSEGKPCQGRFIGNLPRIGVDALRREGVDLVVSVAAGVDGMRHSLASASHLLDSQGLGVVSLFPWGTTGQDVLFSSLPPGKALVVSSAKPGHVRVLLQGMRRLERVTASVLVQAGKESVFQEDVSGREHVFPRTVFDKSAMPEALLREIAEEGYDYAIFPYQHHVNDYANVIGCLVSCGLRDIYCCHVDNDAESHDARMAYKVPLYHRFLHDAQPDGAGCGSCSVGVG